jgi:hemolysin activation/secretion protein
LSAQSGGPFQFLSPVLAEYAGKCIGREGINVIVKRIASLVIAHGYITTRIGVPEQDLSQGTLHLVLIPGVIRAIRVADGSPSVNWRSAFPVRPGDILDLRDLEQGLEQMKRVPSQDVNISIVPGETSGQSDLVIAATRTRPLRLALSLDDSGTKATGKRQGTASLSVDNPLSANDLLTLTLNSDAQNHPTQRGTGGHSLQYSVPWGYWTVFVSESASHYHQLIQGVNQSFVSRGDSSSEEIKVQRLVYRDQTAKTTLQFRAARRILHSFIDDTEIGVQRHHMAAAEIGVAHRQQLGVFQIDLSLSRREGVPWFGGYNDAPDRAPGTPTYRYRLYTGDIGVIASFKLGRQPVRWIGTLHGQTTGDLLYPADYIAIGNRYTVRGFDGETVLAAARGGYLRNELEFPVLDSSHAVYVGIDQGRVGGPSARTLAGRTLVGAVLGARGTAYGFSYDVFAGHALHKPDGFNTAQLVLGFQISYLL